MLKSPPTIGKPETKSLVSKISIKGIAETIKNDFPEIKNSWLKECQSVTGILFKCGIHTVDDYCNYGLLPNEIADNSENINARVFRETQFSPDRLTFFNLGRIHQCLEKYRVIRNERIANAKNESSPKDPKIVEIMKRDIGSAAPFKNLDKKFEKNLEKYNFIQNYKKRTN